MPRRSSNTLPFSEPTSRIKPPDDLTGDARSVFCDLVVACRADHFTESDAPLLAAYARAVVAEKVAAGELAAENVVDDKPSPWLPVWLGKLRAMTTLSRMLRLNPAARSLSPSPSPEPAPPSMSYYAKQRLLEGRDDEPEPN